MARKKAAPIKDCNGVYAWDRRADETQQAYKAFRAYLDMGSERSLLRCAVELSRSRQLIVRWSGTHEWGPRSLAYDSHMTAVEMARREKVREEYAEKAERFRLESANANIDVASRLFSRCLEMLQAPLYEDTITETDADGRATTIIRTPTKWAARDIPLFAKAAADLAQIALFQLSFAEDDDFDPSKASPDELRAYLEKHGVKALPGVTDRGQNG